MKIVIVGGGVVGMTPAYTLANDGADVVVLDRAPAPASETSVVDTGLVAPGHALTWNRPSMLRQLPAVLTGNHDHIEAGRPVDVELTRWGARFVSACAPRTSRRSSLLRWRLARWSLELLEGLIAEEAIACDLTAQGAVRPPHRRHAGRSGRRRPARPRDPEWAPLLPARTRLRSPRAASRRATARRSASPGA